MKGGADRVIRSPHQESVCAQAHMRIFKKELLPFGKHEHKCVLVIHYADNPDLSALTTALQTVPIRCKMWLRGSRHSTGGSSTAVVLD